MPSEYYTMTHEGVRFIFIDTTLLHVCLRHRDGCDPQQAPWVEEQLALATKDDKIDWIVVVGHWSVRSSYPHYYPQFEKWLCPLLADAGATKMVVYLAGDNHFIQLTKFPTENVIYMTNGAGAGTKAHPGTQQHAGVRLGHNSHLFALQGFLVFEISLTVLSTHVITDDGTIAGTFNFSRKVLPPGVVEDSHQDIIPRATSHSAFESNVVVFHVPPPSYQGPSPAAFGVCLLIVIIWIALNRHRIRGK
jgi:hypothetical protein